MSTTLILTRTQVASLLDMATCIVEVERAFRLHAQGSSFGLGTLGVPAEGGGFHIKATGIRDGNRRSYVVVKTNGNFFGNPERGLPRIQGTIILCDGSDGTPLAVMDSIEITRLRTAAASAVAAKNLARAEARVATICGCGVQGRANLDALRHVAHLERVYAYDVDPSVAAAFAADLDGLAPIAGRAAVAGGGKPARLAVTATSDLPAAVAASGIVVTATPARRFILEDAWVAPGTFIAAVGADSSQKQEIEPALLARSRVVVDMLDQCAEFGDLRHAVAAGAMDVGDVHAHLHEVVAGTRPGRTSPDDIFVFDSTGTALQDVVAAAAVYANARRLGIGTEIAIGD